MYKSDFRKPAELLARIDAIAASFGVGSIADHLAADKSAAGGALVLGSTYDSTILRTLRDIAIAASVDITDLDDESFAYMVADFNPIDYGDERMFAFKFADGYIAITRSTKAFSARHDCIGDETTPLDLIVLSRAMKVSQRNRYALFRYNDKGMMSNPVFANGNYTDDSTGRGAGDMWKLFDGMLCEMRSVVVDLIEHKIISLPFYKFRNLGECEAYSTDNVTRAMASAKNVEITDKMDGSFCQMKWMGDDCDLFGASHRLTSMSGSLNPETNENLAFIYEWVSEFESAGKMYTQLCRDYPDWTFIFEFVRPDKDSHIVQYSEDRWGIYLLSARNVVTGDVMFYDELSSLAADYKLPITECFVGYDLDTVLDICHTADVSEREGFVVNIDGWYVKVKLDDFCAISRLVHGSDNFNAIIANVVNGTFDDLLAKIPIAYHESVLDNARQMFSFASDMADYVKHMVSIAPADAPMKEVVAFFQENVPKAFMSLCIDGYKFGLPDEDVCYLLKAPRRENSTCLKEKEFQDRASILASARSEAET